MKILSELGFKYFVETFWNKIKTRYDNKLEGIYSSTAERTTILGSVASTVGEFQNIVLPGGQTISAVDSSLSTVSANPVQNKVLTVKINAMSSDIEKLKNSEVFLTEDEWEELEKHPELIDPDVKYYVYEEKDE